jgi:hypothetical protein
MLLISIVNALASCAPRPSADEIGRAFMAKIDAERAEKMREWEAGAPAREAKYRANAAQAYRDAALSQAQFEVNAAKAGESARKTWIYCVADAVPRLAPAPEPATVILQAAFSSCAAAEAQTVRKWEAAGGSALAQQYRAETRRDLTDRFLPLIVKFHAHGYAVPAAPKTAPAAQ